MAITETVRTAAKLFALPLGLLLGGALVVSLSHRSQARDQLRAECRAKYAAAGTRGDTILADNWIPAPGLSSDSRATALPGLWCATGEDRKSTRLNSSHSQISYAVFCLKKKNNQHRRQTHD